ncbi:hypothetical protein KAH37_02035 [bacterium]|nr:hypothetical protein [bacterium]
MKIEKTTTPLHKKMHASIVDSENKKQKAFYHIIKYAQQGELLGSFLDKTSVILSGIIACDGVRIVAKELDNFYCYDSDSNGEIVALPEFGKLSHSSDVLSVFDLEKAVFFNQMKHDNSLVTDAGGIIVSHPTVDSSVVIKQSGIPHRFSIALEKDVLSFLILPIIFNKEPIGTITLLSHEESHFQMRDALLYHEFFELIGIALNHRHTQVHLRERIKELTCIYKIAKLGANLSLTLDSLFYLMMEVIPPAFLYPEITFSRILLHGKKYSLPDYKNPFDDESLLTSNIVVKGEVCGRVEVGYSEERVSIHQGPFLKEEIKLIDNISREIALIIERQDAEQKEKVLQEQLLHADRLITIGQMAAGVAHELNEPLGSILGFAQLIQGNSNLNNQSSQDLEKIVSASLHAREIVKKLLIFARQMPLEKVAVNLNQLIKESLYLLRPRLHKSNITLQLELDETIPEVKADLSQMNQLIINLSVNAMQAMADGGTLTISTNHDMHTVTLICKDSGTGMSETTQNKIFLPFFTTKDVGEGTGLGLPVALGIVKSHGGLISVDSIVGEGSKFTINLPVRSSDE